MGSLMAMAASRRGLFLSSSASHLLQAFGQSSRRELPMLHRYAWIEALIHIRAGSLGWGETGNWIHPGGLRLEKFHTIPVRTLSTSRCTPSRSMRRIPRRLRQANKETTVEEESVSHCERASEKTNLLGGMEIGNEWSVTGKSSDPGLEGTFIIHGGSQRSTTNRRLQMATEEPPQSRPLNEAVSVTYQKPPDVSSKRSNSFPDSKKVWHEESGFHKSRFDNERATDFDPQPRKTTHPKPAAQSKGSLKRSFSDIQQQRKDVRGHKSSIDNPGWTQGEEMMTSGRSPGDQVQATEVHVETVSADLLEMDSRELHGVQRNTKLKAEELRKYPNQENGKSFPFYKKSKEHLTTPHGHDLLYGISPCLMALQYARREVHQLYVTTAFQNSERSEVKEILALVEERGLKMWTTNRRVLDKFSEQRPHQGVCMETSRLYFSPVQENEDEDLEEGGPVPASTVRLVLDQIKDPMNLGALLRSAYFLGIDKVIVSKKNCCSLTPVVSKASSGVMEVMPVFATPHIASYLEIEKEKGWSIVGASISSSSSSGEVIPCHRYNQTAPLLLVVGNEGFGLSREISDQCSEFISIPAGRQLHPGIDSLNVSVATGILLHSLLGRE